MAIEGPDEWAVFLNTDDFGESVTYRANSRPPVSITGIFTAAYALATQGVATTAPVLVIAETALTTPPQAGDLVTLHKNHADICAGTVLRVADPQSDGSGMARLILERN
ncbi:head-tail joining protein [Roseobacter litoralis]|uniref:head-tail joining protein n=1 Tax=Roseobacter litoralis TaxID=42443 RepID=UPI0024952B56|nr:hypothetical protein [Roseobacter litoralis]